MKIGIGQFAPIWGNKLRNLEQIRQLLLPHPGVQLWILPELGTTGYQFTSRQQVLQLAEAFPGGQSAEILLQISRETQSAIVIGVIESLAQKIYNSAAVFDNGAYRGAYRKIHLFFEEKRWFHAGEQTPPIYEIDGIRVGIMICFDWIFPEIARSLALRGTQVLAHPANLVLPYCQDAMITRSLENRIFSATANRIGSESINPAAPLTFTGKSQITDPTGKRLGQLTPDREDVLIVDIDPSEALEKSITPLNDLFEDRKPDLYRND